MNKMNKEKWQQIYEADRKAILEEMENLIKTDHLDEDGYPTESALRLIEIWHWEDPRDWFKFIKNIWAYTDWGWHEELADHEYRENKKVIRYNISTAGWSGNESIIRAMEKNTWMWDYNWVQSRRGGHYIFDCEVDNGN